MPVLATYTRWPTKHQQKLDQHRSPIKFLGSRLHTRITKTPPWGLKLPHACTLIRYNVVTLSESMTVSATHTPNWTNTLGQATLGQVQRRTAYNADDGIDSPRPATDTHDEL